MEAFFIGLFTLLIGLGITFAGYQFFRVLIPIWGFFAGFVWGADAIAVGLGTGFLATLLGWTVGFVVGALVGVFAYMFYEIAVGVLVGSFGYWLVGSFLLGIGFNPGFFVSTIAILSGVALAVVALYFKAPKGLLVFFSSLAGATATIGGFLVMFGILPPAILGTGLLNAIIGGSFFWTLTWLALAVIGGITQLRVAQAVDQDIRETYGTYGYSSYNNTYSGAKGGRAAKDETEEYKEDYKDKDKVIESEEVHEEKEKTS